MIKLNKNKKTTTTTRDRGIITPLVSIHYKIIKTIISEIFELILNPCKPRKQTSPGWMAEHMIYDTGAGRKDS